jgi:membrane protein
MSQMGRPGRDISWWKFLQAVEHEWSDGRVGDAAGALTFYGVLALFPFLLFVVSLAGLVIDPAAAAELIDDLARVAPPAVAGILGERLRALAARDSTALVTVSALGAIWAASGGAAALMRALNAAYDVQETRPWWKTRIIALLTTLGAAVLILVAASAAIVAPAVVMAFDPSLRPLAWLLRLPVAGFFFLLLLRLAFHVLPNVRLPFRLLSPGTVLAAIVWILASLGFSTYVTHFGRYEVTYGALGGVIVLLFWMWLSTQAMLLGAEVDAILRRVGQARARKEAEERASPAAPPPSAAPIVLAPPPPAQPSLASPRPRRAPSLLPALLPALFFAIGLLVGRRRAR